MLKTQPDISISIVNTNNREITLHCLESVFAEAGDLKLQVILVNNACRDGSTDVVRQRFPQVEIIEHMEMLGFSTNNNLAFTHAIGRYLLMLNDDTIIHPGALESMINYMDCHLDVGAAGPKLLNKDGSWQPSYGYKPNPIYEGLSPFSDFILPRKPTELPLLVGNISGACMLVRSEVPQQIGFLDTRFDPIYSEEIDWCYRIVEAGWAIVYYPEAVVTHLGGSTMDRLSTRRFISIFEKKLIFFRKHYRKSAVLQYQISLIVANSIKLLYWATLLVFKPKEAPIELNAHWNLIKRILNV